MNIGGALGKDDGADAAKDAASAQYRAAQLGVDEMKRQFNKTQQNLLPYLKAGKSALTAVRSGATPSGLNERLGWIMDQERFADLIAAREDAVENQLSQTGLMRSGAGLKAAADIPTDLAMAIENMLYGRKVNLSGGGQNAAAGLGALGANMASGVAGLQSEAGQALAQGQLQAAQANAASGANTLAGGFAGAQLFGPMIQNAAFGALGGTAALDSLLFGLSGAGGTALGAGIGSLLFSDERLKDNMAPIGELGGLTLYEWDWRPEVSPIIGKMSIGFSAQEVEKKYPQFVFEIADFKAIDYPGLIDHIEHQITAEAA